MIIASLEITKPAIATAVPVSEFSREITTGMWAPPIGRTSSTPSTSATTETASRTQALSEPAMR